MADIFEIRDNPDPYDIDIATFRELDGTLAGYTVDRIITMASNALDGHDAMCGMKDCEPVEHPTSRLHRELAESMGMPAPKPEMVMPCLLHGPTTPEIHAKNVEIDADIEARMEQDPNLSAVSKRFLRKKLGFDINRQHDEPR